VQAEHALLVQSACLLALPLRNIDSKGPFVHELVASRAVAICDGAWLGLIIILILIIFVVVVLVAPFLWLGNIILSLFLGSAGRV